MRSTENKARRSIFLTLALWIALWSAPPGYAEDIKNYSDCETCPGAIHYGPDEARRILGTEGLQLIRERAYLDRLIVKVDLDGVLKNGSAGDNHAGYEMEITFLPNIIYIRSLLDGSHIQIVTDKATLQGSGSWDEWGPEIYLQSSISDQISLEDTVPTAWERMRSSQTYKWIFSDRDDRDHLGLLGNGIIYSLKLVS